MDKFCEDGRNLIKAEIEPLARENCRKSLNSLTKYQNCMETFYAKEKKWIKKIKKNGVFEKAKEICNYFNQRNKRAYEQQAKEREKNWEIIEKRKENQSRRVPKDDFNLICERKKDSFYGYGTYGLALQKYDNRYLFIDKDDEPVNGVVLVTIHRDSLKADLNGILTNTSLDYNCKKTSKKEINSYHNDFKERASIFNKKRDEKLRNKI